MAIRRVVSKWAKTNALLADSGLKKFVPATLPFHEHTVRQMLNRMKMVYVKPINGTFGKGVIRIEQVDDAEFPYGFQSGERQYRYRTFESMFRKLLDVKRKRPYLVQQGIELLKYRGRRFDIRLMVQKSPNRKWVSTGLIGRLAHPRKIVTNYHSGGTPMPVEKLLSPHMDPQLSAEYRADLLKFGTAIAGAIEAKFPGVKELGIDIAVDSAGKPWILEVNTSPDPFIFRKLPDRSVFRRIYRYAVHYGRFRRRRKRIGR